MHCKKVPIHKIEHVNEDYFILSIRNKDLTRNIKAGQFFEVKCPDVKTPLLPRPFSVYNAQDDEVGFMIKKIGRSTMCLSQIKEGHIVQILGPLGNGFPVVSSKKVLLVSGGIGYAPLPYLRKILMQNDNDVLFYHGGRNRNDIFCESIENCTDDGSFGHPGFVTEHVERCLDSQRIDGVYTCGPEPMMKTLTSICMARDIPIYVSMERVMACGVGACCGCVISVKENDKIVYKKVCKDGPVFDGTKVVWDA